VGQLDAFKYLTGHTEEMRRYCDDSRPPILNSRSKHVAKPLPWSARTFCMGHEEDGSVFQFMPTSIRDPMRYSGWG